MLSVLALSAHEKCINEFPYQSISSRVFENQPNSNERKGKEKKKGRGEGKEVPWSQRFFLIFLRERDQQQAAKQRQRVA